MQSFFFKRLGIQLGKFIDALCNDPEFKKNGWTRDDIYLAHVQKKKYPTLEYKASVHIPKFLKRHGEKCKVYYNTIPEKISKKQKIKK